MDISSIAVNATGGLIAVEVHGVIHMVLSHISAEIELGRGFNQELEELHQQFTKLTWLLQGASSGQRITNQVMADWLKKINDAAFDAEILLDQWSYKALKHSSQNDFMRTVRRPFSRQAMAHKVRNMRKLIGSIYNDATELGIKPIKVAAGDVYSGTHAHEIEKQDKKLSEQRQFVDLLLFRGRDDDAEKLVKLLCDPINNNSHLTVIGIVGLAGLGKTTLSKHISEVQDVADFFDNLVIWLVVSYSFDLIDLLHKMEENLFIEASGLKDAQALIGKLKTRMKGKKCLLILDDVWDTIHWDSLKSTLREIGVSKGTTLLVTSRDKKVVETLYTPERPTIHQLQGLSPGESWSLFMAKFYDGIVAGSEEENVAKRMVDICGGVPLAIRVLADLLRDNYSVEKWREIEESEIWTSEDKNGILPSLRLSYKYLPLIALKKCFAYCAIFDDDEVIDKQQLIYMWMAQGFLQPNEKMEHTGDRYIEHLLSCSLFQEDKRDEYDRVKTFKMHDLVWTLARSVSRGECLGISSGKYDVTGEVRHLWLRRESGDLTSKCFPKLRTCLLGDRRLSYSPQFWLTCMHLRVLSVGRQVCQNINWEPLRSLIHLRYFAITTSGGNDFMQSNLLDHITKLYHLQTLCIEYRSTYGSNITFSPKELSNLVNIRHILINDDIGVPVGLSHLTALQTLPTINLGLNLGGRISDIGLLTNLRGKLTIKGLSLLTVEEARNLKLSSKSNLESLALRWRNDNSQRVNLNANEILEALQPNVNLHEFQLFGFDGTTFPRWLRGPGSPLNKIVSLRILCCHNADGILNVESFTCLHILKVESCKKLSITFPNNSSQCCVFLKELLITGCDEVELSGLLLLRKLEVLHIRGNKSTSRDVLVGLGSLPYLRQLQTDLQVPVDLAEQSPVCKSLEDLTLYGTRYYSLPEQLQHLVALRKLSIWEFKSLEAMPNWLGKLTSLESLHLYRIPKLKQLPPQDVMLSLTKLKELNCSGCPLLEEDIKTKSGEWCKIFHIPHTRLS